VGRSPKPGRVMDKDWTLRRQIWEHWARGAIEDGDRWRRKVLERMLFGILPRKELPVDPAGMPSRDRGSGAGIARSINPKDTPHDHSDDATSSPIDASPKDDDSNVPDEPQNARVATLASTSTLVPTLASVTQPIASSPPASAAPDPQFDGQNPCWPKTVVSGHIWSTDILERFKGRGIIHPWKVVEENGQRRLEFGPKRTVRL